MRLLAPLLVFCAVALSVQDPFLQKSQDEWNKTTTFRTRFTQKIQSKLTRSIEDSTGIIFVSKPGKLRWEAEDGTTQILNGKRVIVTKRNRRRKNRNVDIFENGITGLDTGPLAFLSRGPNLFSDFKVLKLKEAPTAWHYRFDPKGTQSESYVAEIDKSGYFLAALTLETSDARVRIEFQDRVINLPLDSKLFEYVPEPGDVVRKQ